MTDEKDCPLTPALRRLLQACIDHHTIQEDTLAAALHLSPHTIHTQFSRIGRLLGTHERFASVLTDMERGWVTQDAGTEQE